CLRQPCTNHHCCRLRLIRSPAQLGPDCAFDSFNKQPFRREIVWRLDSPIRYAGGVMAFLSGTVCQPRPLTSGPPVALLSVPKNRPLRGYVSEALLGSG